MSEPTESSGSEWERDLRATATFDDLLACLRKHQQVVTLAQGEYARRRIREINEEAGGDPDFAEERLFQDFKRWLLTFQSRPEPPRLGDSRSPNEPPVGTRQPRRGRPSDKASSA